jgi:hypothetical protein
MDLDKVFYAAEKAMFLPEQNDRSGCLGANTRKPFKSVRRTVVQVELVSRTGGRGCSGKDSTICPDNGALRQFFSAGRPGVVFSGGNMDMIPVQERSRHVNGNCIGICGKAACPVNDLVDSRTR